MQIKYLRIVSVLLLIAMIASFTNSPALPQGKGVQKYNPGLGWEPDFLLKGEFYHALYYDTDLTVKAGSWVTLYFALGDIVTHDDIDLLIQFFKDDLVPNTDWSFLFNGEDITTGMLAGMHYEHPLIYDLGGGYYLVLIVAVYYIVPQAIGCYSYYNFYNDHYYPVNEKIGSICWMPASYF